MLIQHAVIEIMTRSTELHEEGRKDFLSGEAILFPVMQDIFSSGLHTGVQERESPNSSQLLLILLVVQNLTFLLHSKMGKLARLISSPY